VITRGHCHFNSLLDEPTVFAKIRRSEDAKENSGIIFLRIFASSSLRVQPWVVRLKARIASVLWQNREETFPPLFFGDV
jgi:hypothetical protein